MLKCRFFSSLILFLLLPSLLIYPLGNPKTSIAELGAKKEYTSLTYDSILQLLEEIETGALKNKCSLDQLWKINRFIALLAYEGMRSNDASAEIALNQDILYLLYDESPFYYASSTDLSRDFYFARTLSHDTLRENIQQCGWVSKKWKSTKKFVKKHKTAIIVGAVIVVAATVVVVAVSASSAAAAAAGAAGAAAASDSKPNESPSLSKKEESPSLLLERGEETLVQEVIKEKASLVKEVVYEDVNGNSSSQEDPISLAEKGREVGAHLAHQVFDEIAEYVKLGPEFIEEVKELGSKLLPEGLLCENNELIGNAVENYEKNIEKGHEAIDRAFSTDQAEFYTKEAKKSAFTDQFSIGIMPLPGCFNSMFKNASHFRKAGKVLDRAGFTKSGRALMKHGYREGSVFPKPLGNPEQINRQGQVILEEILNDPNNKVYRMSDGSLKVYSSNGRGAAFKKDGSFNGFREQQYE